MLKYFGFLLASLFVIFILTRKMKNRNSILAIGVGSFVVFTILKYFQGAFLNYSNLNFFVNVPLTILMVVMFLPIILGSYNRFRSYVNKRDISLTYEQILLSVVISALVVGGLVFIALWEAIFLYL